MPATADNDITPVLQFHVGYDGDADQSYILDEMAGIPRRGVRH